MTAVVRGGKNELEVATRGEVFYLQPKCRLKNNTAKDYRFDTNGALMLVNQYNGGLERLDGATWDTNVTIPAGQTVNVKFNISSNLSEYGETAANLTDLAKLNAFADKRMSAIKDLKFFDYAERYQIDCPDSWMEK